MKKIMLIALLFSIASSANAEHCPLSTESGKIDFPCTLDWDQLGRMGNYVFVGTFDNTTTRTVINHGTKAAKVDFTFYKNCSPRGGTGHATRSGGETILVGAGETLRYTYETTCKMNAKPSMPYGYIVIAGIGGDKDLEGLNLEVS